MRTVAIFALALLTVCGVAVGRQDSSRTNRKQVLHVVHAGEHAILVHRPARVCALLTRRARRNSLKAYDGHYRTNPVGGDNPDGRPRPHTCRQAIDDELDFARMDGDSRADILAAMRPTKIVRIRGRRAHVRVGDSNEVYLLKTRHGWRADYASFSPFDGSSGY